MESIDTVREQSITEKVGQTWSVTEGETSDRGTARVYRLLANDILPRSVRMEESVPEDSPEG